jgi:hypothetical protein
MALRFMKRDEEYVIRLGTVADFVIGDGGRSITLFRYEASRSLAHVVRDTLVRHALSLALLVQGVCTFHGNCVSRDGVGVGLIGANGSGKSTLTAAFLAQGWSLVSDGMFIAYENGGRLVVYDGIPELRLRPDAAEQLGYGATTPYRDLVGVKHHVSTRGRNAELKNPVELRAIYLLDRRTGERQPRTQRLTGAAAIAAAVANSYSMLTCPRELLAVHLAHMSGVLGKAPFHRLSYPSGFEHLARVCVEIVKNCG